MNARIHIERLVVDEGVLAPRDRTRFQAAVAAELSRLRGAVSEPRDRPVDAVQTLARSTAGAIHDRMPRS